MGWIPVQYGTVVVMSGVGNMKLTAVSPYDMILVVSLRTWNKVVLFEARKGRVVITDGAIVVDITATV